MIIDVARKWFNDECTIGELRVDGEFCCFTLEDKYREVVGSPVKTWKVAGSTAIPVGKYEVVIDFSPRFQRSMPHILEVPGFTGVRIHCGNDSGDVCGCLCVGRQRYKDSVGESRLAYQDLLTLIAGAVKDKEKVEIYIRNWEEA